ncbi:MAG: endonuclease/exonuclease/phosphatase family protein [Bacteroidetes bacterium]|nr:MAG: endonuclease/exonuclease/phosphatase family protein [Bacteroidota bacterium]
MKRKMIYAIIIITGIPVAAVLAMILYLQLTEYMPAPMEPVATEGKGRPIPSAKTEFSCLTWNIGYAGLGKEMDFFYEGGRNVRSSETNMDNNLVRIYADLKSDDTLDFILLQEIDKESKRTYYKDQLEDIKVALPEFCSAYALNYLVKFIPIPLSEPTGKVTSGLCTFSKHPPENNERHAYDAFFSWPKRIFWLKRCFIASSYVVSGGKQLIVINLHNSAYDESGKLRSKELALLQLYLLREYQKGNYIIIGGDWNMNPKGFSADGITSGDRVYEIKPRMEADFMPGWQMVYDPSLPTNRDLDTPYNKGKTGTTIIDFFMISPNVKVLNCFTVDKGFTNSDHNPVFAKFRLQTESPGFSFF